MVAVLQPLAQPAPDGETRAQRVPRRNGGSSSASSFPLAPRPVCEEAAVASAGIPASEAGGSASSGGQAGGSASSGGQAGGSVDAGGLAGGPAEQVDSDMLAKGPRDGALLELSSEAVTARAKEIPVLPPLAERYRHRLTHLPYRNWCRFCVAGRTKEDGHRVKDRSGDEVPEVMMDYAFGDAETIILVIVDRMTGCVNTSQQIEKGATDHAIGTSTKDTASSDQEPAILNLARAVQQARTKHDTILQQGPRKDPQSKGLVESNNAVVEGLARVCIGAIRHFYKIDFNNDHPLLSWVIRHVGY
eukprot:6479842-Amphidinium_carterae.2